MYVMKCLWDDYFFSYSSNIANVRGFGAVVDVGLSVHAVYQQSPSWKLPRWTLWGLKASEFIYCNLKNSSRAAKQLIQHCESISRTVTMKILFELSISCAELIIRCKGLSQEPTTEALCNRSMRT